MRKRCADALPRIEDPVSIAPLHGRACWYCGAVARGLRPIGHVQRKIGTRVGTVVSRGCRALAPVGSVPPCP